MRNGRSKIGNALAFVLIASCLLVAIITPQGKSLQLDMVQQRPKEAKITDSDANFPCIKFNPTAPNLSKEQREAFEKYQNFMRYGYPTDVPLSQAVKEFNDCFYRKEESPLTEKEVIAALLGGDETSRTLSDPEPVQADFEKILYKRLFPKGAKLEIAGTTELSLIIDDDSRELRAAFNATKLTLKRWVITLIRGLDRKPIEGEPLAPGQAFVIRMRYYGFE